MTEELLTGTLHLKVNVPCSRTQCGATTGHPTQDLSIRSPMLHHYATSSPTLNEIFKQCKFRLDILNQGTLHHFVCLICGLTYPSKISCQDSAIAFCQDRAIASCQDRAILCQDRAIASWFISIVDTCSAFPKDTNLR